MSILEAKSSLIHHVSLELEKLGYPQNPNLSLLVEQIVKRYPFEFTDEMGPDILAKNITYTWSLIQQRAHKERLVSIHHRHLSHHQAPRTSIDIINDDRPFIVESVLTVLRRWGLQVEGISHPVIGVIRSPSGALETLIDLWGEEAIPMRILRESVVTIQVKGRLSTKEEKDLLSDLQKTLAYTEIVVDDWPLMLGYLTRITKNINAIDRQLLPLSDEQCQDVCSFSQWLANEHFIFLGVRYFSIKGSSSSGIFCLDHDPDAKPIGIFREDNFMNSDDLVPAFTRVRLVSDPEAFQKKPLQPITVMKTNLRSPVDRPSRLDTIEFIDWDEKGNPRGLYQFVGMFTKLAFGVSAFQVPYVARKVQHVFDRFGVAPRWHDGKKLIHIMDSIPRDELFYLSEGDLFTICYRVFNLKERDRVAVFLRHDIYGRYTTVLVYVSRDRYSNSLKEEFGAILEDALSGKMTSNNVHLAEQPFARLIYVITHDKPFQRQIEIHPLEAKLMEACLSWEDKLEKLFVRKIGEEQTQAMMAKYLDFFPVTYQDMYSPEHAVEDITYLEKLSKSTPIDVRFYQNRHGGHHVKIYHHRAVLSLSNLLPILQNFGFQVLSEITYELSHKKEKEWVHDFEISLPDHSNWTESVSHLEEAFHAVWSGETENDGFQQLILKANLTGRQVMLVRSYMKYLRQAQLPYSMPFVETVLGTYPHIVREIVHFFEARFSLAKRKKSGKAVSTPETEEVLERIFKALEGVVRLDHDRILRRFLNVVQSTVRTNYYQTARGNIVKPYMSFKLDSQMLEDLPLPRPLFEIWVYSSRVEAVHLRGGKVARGGIRWSDRNEDFRIEVLGLMKAQTVKNAVIVPLGSKGGFVVKRLESFSDRAALQKEVVECYEIMMHGLLDLTDNIKESKIIHPEKVVRYDEDDPYLVVAADKGTSTFSDIANKISTSYGFWLDDAFASGGSAGYDHKKMGITARGAWESVKRHFREMERDTQTEPFTVAGIGDMSGDVFGNGMLLSEKIRLVAAMDHRHIFIDPNPDLDMSYQERLRLFQLPRSSWADYRSDLISEGGGVFDRSAKTIKISPQIRDLLKLDTLTVSPHVLCQAVLMAPVDLLWFGGIGTFIKASTESHNDAKDRTNNDIRIDARQVRAKVIGEGANLGVTQQGRIEYALMGGRINTDAIDNSAGVDCSDHEVNIKILFNTIQDRLNRADRDKLLIQMTSKVSDLVLADNYRQTQILSVLERAKQSGINAAQGLMRSLEQENLLNRPLEFLPDDEVLENRRTRHQGLTRPELAILLSYSKISLYSRLLSSSLPDQDFYTPLLIDYFPKAIETKFPEAIHLHPLKREIIATVMANEVINRVGPFFLQEMIRITGGTEVQVIQTFFKASELLNLPHFWDAIDALDSLLIADVQMQTLTSSTRVLEQVFLWFLRHPEVTQKQLSNLPHLQKKLDSLLPQAQKELFMAEKKALEMQNVPEETAQLIVSISYWPALLDIAYLSTAGYTDTKVAETYFMIQSQTGIDQLLGHSDHIIIESDWQKAAKAGLIDDLFTFQAQFTRSAIEGASKEYYHTWLEKHRPTLEPLRLVLANFNHGGRGDLSLLGYAIRQLQRI